MSILSFKGIIYSYVSKTAPLGAVVPPSDLTSELITKAFSPDIQPAEETYSGSILAQNPPVETISRISNTRRIGPNIHKDN